MGSLYSLSYPEMEEVSPEFWKSRLQEAIQRFFQLWPRGHRQSSAWKTFIGQILPLWIYSVSSYGIQTSCPFSLCLQAIIQPFYQPSIREHSAKSYQEIRLQDLSPSEAQECRSLLKPETFLTELAAVYPGKGGGQSFLSGRGHQFLD